MKKNKPIKITYQCVGSKEENQEVLDRVFDIMFEKVYRRRCADKLNAKKKIKE